MAQADSQRKFPWTFTPEVELPAWQAMRTEGGSKAHALVRAPLYAIKMYRKKFSAPPEEVAYFDLQRELFRSLATLPPEGVRMASLAMVGDIMWIREGWDSFLSPEVRDALNEHDLVLGNLETQVAPSQPISRNWPVGVTFNSHPDLVRGFRRPDGRSTFSALGIANNHALDLGDSGLRETMEFLRQEGIPFSGARVEASEPSHVVVSGPGGLRLGFHATTWGMNDNREERSSLLLNLVPGLALPKERAPETAGVREALRAMEADGVSLKVVGIHWGYEYELYPDPVQMQVARDLVLSGADIVLGSHPHVAQPDEVCFLNGYEERLAPDLRARVREQGCVLNDGTGRPRKALVIYSLGNFVTRMTTALCQMGMVRHVSLVATPEGNLDWTVGGRDFVYNQVKGDGAREQRLVSLNTHLKEHCGSACPRELQDAIRFLSGHL